MAILMMMVMVMVMVMIDAAVSTCMEASSHVNPRQFPEWGWHVELVPAALKAVAPTPKHGQCSLWG